MSKLKALKRKKRNDSPYESERAVSRPYKGPTSAPTSDPYPNPRKYQKPPEGRCGACTRSARHWYVAEPEPGWRYFINGIECAGPSPQAFCTLSCAREVEGPKTKKLNEIDCAEKA